MRMGTDLTISQIVEKDAPRGFPQGPLLPSRSIVLRTDPWSEEQGNGPTNLQGRSLVAGFTRW